MGSSKIMNLISTIHSSAPCEHHSMQGVLYKAEKHSCPGNICFCSHMQFLLFLSGAYTECICLHSHIMFPFFCWNCYWRNINRLWLQEAQNLFHNDLLFLWIMWGNWKHCTAQTRGCIEKEGMYQLHFFMSIIHIWRCRR